VDLDSQSVYQCGEVSLGNLQLKSTPYRLSIFLIILVLRTAQYHTKKGAIRLFCKFEIIPDEMARNGAFLNS